MRLTTLNIILVTLVGCVGQDQKHDTTSSKDDDDSTPVGTVSKEKLKGRWQQGCLLQGGDGSRSILYSMEFKDNNELVYKHTLYTGSNCDSENAIRTVSQTFSYSLAGVGSSNSTKIDALLKKQTYTLHTSNEVNRENGNRYCGSNFIIDEEKEISLGGSCTGFELSSKYMNSIRLEDEILKAAVPVIESDGQKFSEDRRPTQLDQIYKRN